MKTRLTHLIVVLVFVATGAARAGLPVGSEEETRRIELVARLEHSVVLIHVEGREIEHRRAEVTFLPSESLGTGVVLSRDGLLLTAAHVVEGAERIVVRLADDQQFPARVVFEDEMADIALLRLDGERATLEPAALGDSDKVRKGETAYVLGNPLGIERTLTVGVISGRHTLPHVFGGNVQAEVIQTDAAINQGNSGGPIFNSRGEVIAIAQRIMTESGGSEGLGFGLAINSIKRLLDLDPCVWMGFGGVALDGEWTDALNVPEPGAILVERVTPGSPASRAGLRGGSIPVMTAGRHLLLGGDVILRIEGRLPIAWRGQPAPLGTPEGTHRTFALTILRGGQLINVPIETIHRSAW